MSFNLYRWITALGLVALTGCATSQIQRLENVKVGMDKTEVLETAGNPKYTQRKNSADIWVYIYYVGEKKFERGLRFENSRLTEILPELETRPGADAMASDVVVRDYEKLVEDAAKAKKSKFVPVGDGD